MTIRPLVAAAIVALSAGQGTLFRPRAVPYFSGGQGWGFVVTCQNVGLDGFDFTSIDDFRLDGVVDNAGKEVKGGNELGHHMKVGEPWSQLVVLFPRVYEGQQILLNDRRPLPHIQGEGLTGTWPLIVPPLKTGKHTIAFQCGGVWSDDVPFYWNQPQAASQTAPNFSGVWKLDTSKSGAVGGGRGAGGGAPGGGMGGGLGLGPSADELAITQTTTTMIVDERRGTTSSRLIFTFDGKKADNSLPAGRNSGRNASYVSQWKDGRLVTKITAIDASNNKLEYTETRSLDADGALIVETSSGGSNSRRVVYAKIK